VIIRSSRNPDDLLARFEGARRIWIEVQDQDYERPVFYAAGRTDEGIAIVNSLGSAREHRAFGQWIHAHIHGMGMQPDEVGERKARLGLRQPLPSGEGQNRTGDTTSVSQGPRREGSLWLQGLF
jgi:hypothetical protein